MLIDEIIKVVVKESLVVKGNVLLVLSSFVVVVFRYEVSFFLDFDGFLEV